MIKIIDYGLGNIQAFTNIYKRLDKPVTVVRTANELAGASHIILPGVGAFDWAMIKLNQSGMREALDDMVLRRKVPVLGICVGMQMMARNSDEGDAEGLGWIDASVKLFDDSSFENRTHLPHMGWNDVEPAIAEGLFHHLGENARFYFLHSYYFAPNIASDVLATTVYGNRFACAIRRENIYGVQFHPEKSHSWGTKLLMNFAEL